MPGLEEVDEEKKCGRARDDHADQYHCSLGVLTWRGGGG